MPPASASPGDGRTGVLVVGHDGLPQALLAAARHIVGDGVPATAAVGIAADAAPEESARRIARAIATLDTGRGVLILIDVAGATPFNAARAAARHAADVRLVAGVNLAMLVRVYNYAGRTLAELVDVATDGGERGIAAL